MKYFTRIGDRERVFFFSREDGQLFAECDGRKFAIDLSMVGDGTAFSLIVDHQSHDVLVETSEAKSSVQIRGEVVQVLVEDERERTANEVAGARPKGKRTVTASMPGVVIEVPVAVGDVVADGQTLVLLEAMKMQNPIQAEGVGTVVKVHVTPGQALGAGTPLLDLDG